MAGAVDKMLDMDGIGAGKPQLEAQKSLTLPYGVRLKQSKLQMEALPLCKRACRPVFALSPPSDVIRALV
jgi:hypothetical protein